MSSLFDDRAPKEGALFSIFMGGVRYPEVCELGDPEVMEIIRKEICSLMELKRFTPDLFRIIRHTWAIPPYESDSEFRLEAIKDVEQSFPGLIIGGNLRNGIGMADRIAQATLLADAVV